MPAASSWLHATGVIGSTSPASTRVGHDDPVELVAEVVGVDLVGEEVDSHLRARDDPRAHVGIRLRRPVQRVTDLHEALESLDARRDEVGIGDGAGLLAAEALEHLECEVGAELRGGAGQDQPGRQLRVPNRHALRDHAAEGVPEDDRPVEAEDVAEPDDVVDPRVQVPALGRARVAAALAAMVEVHELRRVGERLERLERNELWSKPGPPWSNRIVGRSRSVGPSATRPGPSTSTWSLTSPTWTRTRRLYSARVREMRS